MEYLGITFLEGQSSKVILNKSPPRSIVGGNSCFVYMDCPVNSSATFYIKSTKEVCQHI